MKSLLIAVAFVFVFAAGYYAQPRPVGNSSSPESLPDMYEARYEGGIFGSSAKEKGTLKFDDTNDRVVFYKKDQREMFSIPYNSLVVIYPDSRESVPQAGKVISALPLPGAGLAGLSSKSTKYANLSFDDPEVEAKGTASFRFDKKEALLAFIEKLGSKAQLKKRGDAYYRPRGRAVY